MIAGLGNPGSEYEGTRHNLGFSVLDDLCRRLSTSFRKSNNYQKAEGLMGGTKVLLIKPLTYMNLSGNALSRASSYYKIDVDNLIVVHDDLDIEPGRIKIRVGGGSAGHKGIDSVISSLGSPEFIRIKVGIGRPPYDNVEKYVLGRPDAEDREKIARAVSMAADAVEMLIGEGAEKAMNIFNSDPQAGQ